MKNTKSKISPPQSIEHFTDDVLQYAKEELTYIKSEIKEMVKEQKKE